MGEIVISTSTGTTTKTTATLPTATSYSTSALPVAIEIPTVPKEWPTVVADQYVPIQILGRGSFASVILARRKKESNTDDKQEEKKEEQNGSIAEGSRSFVAIKRVDDIGYARREFIILQQISHPNIMKVIDYWESSSESSSHASSSKLTATLALSYHSGPTLETLLLEGGALSTKFGRVVIAQIIDAVGYLHSRAIIHRDIKPDNIIVSGVANVDQNDIWFWNDNRNDNEDESDHDVNVLKYSRSDDDEDDDGPEEDSTTATTTASWKDLLKRWHVTLVDFGFARTLTAEDMVKPTPSRTSVDDDEDDNISISRKFRRRMSALGTKDFVAPEITNLMVEQDIPNTGTESFDITKTLHRMTSEYGIMVDAYSLGQTLRHMMTGVVPGYTGYYNLKSVKEQARQKRHRQSGGSIGRWTMKTTKRKSLQDSSIYVGKDSKSTCCRRPPPPPPRRKVLHLRLEEIEDQEAIDLIQDFTHPNEWSRLSVRTARRSRNWITDVLPPLSPSSTMVQEIIDSTL